VPTLLSLPVVSVACGRAHSLFATISGDIYATGANTFGQLGVPGAKHTVYRPVQVPALQGSQIGMITFC